MIITINETPRNCNFVKMLTIFKKNSNLKLYNCLFGKQHCLLCKLAIFPTSLLKTAKITLINKRPHHSTLRLIEGITQYCITYIPVE